MRKSHARPGSSGQSSANTKPRRDREAVANIALAVAEHLVVDGQHKGVVLRRFRPLDHFAREAAIGVDEYLHPARRRPGRGDVLQRAGGAVTGAVERAGGGRGTRRCAFAIRPEQPRQSGRRDAERHGKRCSEQRDRRGRAPQRRSADEAAARHRRTPVRCGRAFARLRRRRRRNRTPARAARGGRQCAPLRRCRGASVRPAQRMSCWRL